MTLVSLWQGNETAKRLADDDKAGKLPKELYNHYTVILSDAASGEYSQIANSSFFKEEVSAILAAFDRWIAGRPLCSCVHSSTCGSHLGDALKSSRGSLFECRSKQGRGMPGNFVVIHSAFTLFL